MTSPVAAGQTLTLYAIWRPIASASPAVRRAPAGDIALGRAGQPGRTGQATGPGYYVGRIADDTGLYGLIVGDDQAVGFIRIDFDTGESLFSEAEVIMLTDTAIVVATEDGGAYWLLR